MSPLDGTSDTASQFSVDSDLAGNTLRLLLFKLPKSLRAAALLRQADKAQASTLRLLEKYRTSMDKPIHDDLHGRYDALKANRLKIKRGFMKQAKQWNKVVAYKFESLDLYDSTVITSDLARSKKLWSEKADPGQVETTTPKSDSSSPSRRSALDGTVSDFVNARSTSSEDDRDLPTFPVGLPSAPQAEETATPPLAPHTGEVCSLPAAPQVEDDIADQPYYGAVEVNSRGQLIGDTISVLSQIELNTMVKRGQLAISKKPAGDNPFGDTNAVASTSTTTVV